MSSPVSQLKKTKKSPLPDTRRRARASVQRVPFRDAGPEVAVERDSRRRVVEGIVPHTTRGGKTKAPSDAELLGSMAVRLAQVEKEMLAAMAEIVEKDAKIQELEQTIATLHQSPPPPPPPQPLHEVEVKCRALQRQVEEMEEFLNDYGMIWVGGGGDQGEGVEGEGEGGRVAMKEQCSTWDPDSSVMGKCLSVDFDLIVKNVKTLNVLAGEGSVAVVNTPRGATMKAVEPVPLTLYSNGIVLFQGPFRPFTHPATQQCVQDLMEGYFPSELQSCYPDGVPLKLSDQRDVTFVPRHSSDLFPGCGHKLGGQKGPSKLLPRAADNVHTPHTTSDPPGPRLSTEQFLSRLPATVVRGGRVVDVRAGIAKTLQGSGSGSSTVTLVDTPALQEIRSRLSTPDPPMPSTVPSTSSSSPLTTLRVKSEGGDQTFVLRMRASDTIGDVWAHLSTHPGVEREGRQLKSGVTRTTYSDLSATLRDSGLTPNANLYIWRAAEAT